MSYPDLMYFQAPSGRVIPSCVFEDMKLDTMIRPETAAVMGRMCVPEDIPLRQEMFRALSDSNFRRHLQKLADDMTLICDVAERYEEARCDEERNALFVNLAQAMTIFFDHAAQYDHECALYARFRDYFRDRLKLENYRRVTGELEKLMPKLEAILTVNIRLEGEDMRLQDDAPSTYLSRLIHCAEELSLGAVAPQKMAPRPLDASVIRAVAALHPEVFAELAAFYRNHRHFYEQEILRYRDQLGFYLDLCALSDWVRAANIPMTYPTISAEKKLDIHTAYDITLLTKGEENIIPNDAFFNPDEPFFYLTGANGGGKTTYLRTVGVTVLLFLAGCPAPCVSAELYPLAGVYTHFPRDERFNNAGRGVEEQIRVDEVLAECGDSSLILLNETYSTTSEETAIERTVKLAERIYHSGCFGIFVTHMHGVGETDIPYLNVLIDREDSNRRTFKVARQSSVRSSYAQDILKKYALTAEELRLRFGKGE